MDENFGDIMRQAAENTKAFHSAFYKVYSENYRNIQVVSNDENISDNEEFFMLIPQEYEEQYVNVLTAGLKGKEAHDLLRETYGF